MRPVLTALDGADHITVELTGLRGIVLRALRMLLETVVVPTLLLLVLLHYAGLVPALCAVLGWCALVVGVRLVLCSHLPGTLLLCTGMLCCRVFLALATTSAVVYVLQPAIGSLVMALLFLGSAAIGRPITLRLVRDFVELPAQLFHRHGVRRLFTQVALVFGASRLIDAGMSIGFLHWGVEAGLLSRGVGSGVLTLITIVVCIHFGWRKLTAMGGITFNWGWHPAAAAI